MKTILVKNFGRALLCLVAVGILVVLLLPPWAEKASAQPYYTNVVAGVTNPLPFGAQTPNQNVPQRYLPSATIAAQGAAGICAGVIQPGYFPAAGCITNFAANVTYTAPPVVTAVTSGSGTNVLVAVTAVTTTNFTLSLVATNAVTVYWQALGH